MSKNDNNIDKNCSVYSDCWTHKKYVELGEEFLKQKSVTFMKDFYTMKDYCQSCKHYRRLK